MQHIDMQNETAEFGIFMGNTEGLGKGVGTEANALTVAYAFQELGLHKLYSRVLSYNVASRKMLERVGYSEEGYFKDELVIEGKRTDVVFYGIINSADK